MRFVDLKTAVFFFVLQLQAYLRIYDGEINPQVPILFQPALYSSAFSNGKATLHCEHNVLKASREGRFVVLQSIIANVYLASQQEGLRSRSLCGICISLFLQGFSPGTPVSSHWLKTSLCGLAINWPLVQGVMLPSPYDSWDSPQRPECRRSGDQKMDGQMHG